MKRWLLLLFLLLPVVATANDLGWKEWSITIDTAGNFWDTTTLYFDAGVYPQYDYWWRYVLVQAVDTPWNWGSGWSDTVNIITYTAPLKSGPWTFFDSVRYKISGAIPDTSALIAKRMSRDSTVYHGDHIRVYVVNRAEVADSTGIGGTEYKYEYNIVFEGK